MNFVFANTAGVDVHGEVSRVLDGWGDVPNCVLGLPVGCGSPLRFYEHGTARPLAFQLATAFADPNGCFTFGTDRYHLRVGRGDGNDTSRGFGEYYLGAGHRDTGCPHVGIDFNNTREGIAGAFEAEGYRVDSLRVGNTDRSCGALLQANICASSDGWVAVIWMRPPDESVVSPKVAGPALPIYYINHGFKQRISPSVFESCFFDPLEVEAWAIEVLDAMPSGPDLPACQFASGTVTPSPTPTDSTPPTVSLISSCSDPGNAGWCRGAAGVDVQATDSGSGVSRVECRTNGGNWTSTTDVEFSDEGIYLLECRAVDNVGNWSAVMAVEIRIDSTPPVTLGFVTGSLDTLVVFRSAADLELEASDNLSGVASTTISFDGRVTTQEYVGPIDLAENRVYVCVFGSVDIAGNQEGDKSCGPIDVQRFVALTKSLMKYDRATTVTMEGISHSNGNVALTYNTTVVMDVLNYIGQLTSVGNTSLTIDTLARVSTPVRFPEYPLSYYRERCQVVVGNVTLSAPSPTFDGCIYATGNITFTSTCPTGRLTLVSEGAITDKTTCANLRAWDEGNGLLFYGAKGYVTTATNPVYNGVIYAPYASISGSATHVALTGSMMASSLAPGSSTTVDARQAAGFPPSRRQLPLTQVAVFTSISGEDGYIVESSETSGLGGSATATGAAIRIGDDSSDRQHVGVAAFDTGSLPDNAIVTGADIYLRRSNVSGTSPYGTHGALRVDVVAGWFGVNALLEKGDFQAIATAPSAAVLSVPATNGAWSSGSLNANGVAALNRMGRTQLRLRFELDDNDDRGTDYVELASGDELTALYRPFLIVKYRLE